MGVPTGNSPFFLPDLDKPVSGKLVPLIWIALWLIPFALMSEQLLLFRLQADDFDYFARSRSLDETLRTLVEPHNAHFVGVFRFWNWAVRALAASWERLP